MAEAASLARQAASGLAFLHRHGISHLCLTPTNCLLTSCGEDCFAKVQLRLTDYGPAGEASRPAAGSGTAPESWLACAAPEVLRGEAAGRQVRANSKLESFGLPWIVLYPYIERCLDWQAAEALERPEGLGTWAGPAMSVARHA